MMNVYEDLEAFVASCEYDVRCLGFDPYNAKEFVTRWENENGPFGDREGDSRIPDGVRSAWRDQGHGGGS